jgi:hypothetical protein
MSLTETPILYALVVFLIISWIVLSLVFTVYGIFVRIDAQKDIDARHLSGTNSGKEILAKLVRRMGTLKIIAFSTWFLTGLYAISPWSLQATGPPWRRLIVPLGMNIGLVAIGTSLITFQRERRRVLIKDTAIEFERLHQIELAKVQAAQDDIQSRNALTAATADLAQATKDQTEVLQSVPAEATAAQIENTRSTDALTISTDKNTNALEVKTFITLHETDDTKDAE